MASAGSERTGMNTLPLETMQARATEQRDQLHHTAQELRHKIQQTRENLLPSTQARNHLAWFSIAAAALGLVSGYVAAGLFTTTLPTTRTWILK